MQNLKWLSVCCFLLAVACTLFPVALFGGCGRKTIVKPPELAAPEPVNDLTLEVKDKGVTLHWGRVQKSADGEDLDDLGGFVVLRAEQDVQGKSSEFTQIATIPVEDRDRFRKDKRFSYTDEQLTAGALYRYRVLAFTVDGYYSEASNTVELVWRSGA
ncbi:MAG TPA: fibronectin type III domain-containing protein [Methylomirabilota bacterium]|nr:fibronectin type III domain-containing protein [Methylomirabilota bacterium]